MEAPEVTPDAERISRADRRLWFRVACLERVDRGLHIPWWAGVAWYDHETASTVYGPIGVARLAGCLRWFFWAMKGPVTPHEREQLESKQLVWRHATERLCERIEALEADINRLEVVLRKEPK